MRCDHNASGFRLASNVFESHAKPPVTRLSHQRVNGLWQPPESAARQLLPLPEWMHPLTINVLQKTPGSSARLKGLGVVVSVAIAVMAIYALTHALKHVDFDEVFAIVRRTNPSLIALALTLVACSYGSLTLYDLL